MLKLHKTCLFPWIAESNHINLSGPHREVLQISSFNEISMHTNLWDVSFLMYVLWWPAWGDSLDNQMWILVLNQREREIRAGAHPCWVLLSAINNWNQLSLILQRLKSCSSTKIFLGLLSSKATECPCGWGAGLRLSRSSAHSGGLVTHCHQHRAPPPAGTGTLAWAEGQHGARAGVALGTSGFNRTSLMQEILWEKLGTR